MQIHGDLLSRAAEGALPEHVDASSGIDLDVLGELIDAGYVTATDASSFGGTAYLTPKITLAGREYLQRLKTQEPKPRLELIQSLERLKDLMVDVSTGGRRIQETNAEYRQIYERVGDELSELGLSNANTFPDLWDWYGRWSSGDLPSYGSRRRFLSELFNPMITQVRQVSTGSSVRIDNPTGWTKVDRTVGEIRLRLGEARSEEQLQAVGLLCREALISLAQAVHDPLKHPPLDDRLPSETDAKRLLESYISAELGGSAQEEARKHARSAYNLAVALQHRRTATFRDAALCTEATGSVINVIAIVSGRRDPRVAPPKG